MKYVTTIGAREFIIEISDDGRILLDGRYCEVDFDAICDQPVYSLLLDGRSYEAYVYPVDKEWQVLLHGHLYPARVEDEREKRLRTASEGELKGNAEFNLKAPMPGLVVAVMAEDGQKVNKGDVLVILESMKMQNELKSPREGTVARLRVGVGDSVEQHQTLLSVL
jgi:biotin carboxyl carrier protein